MHQIHIFLYLDIILLLPSISYFIRIRIKVYKKLDNTWTFKSNFQLPDMVFDEFAILLPDINGV